MGGNNAHVAPRPLHLLDYVQAAVHDELVQVPGLVAEARLAVAALLGCAEVILEQRVVLGANYGEVVGHCLVVLSVDHLFAVQPAPTMVVLDRC